MVALNPINILMTTGDIIKNETITKTLYNSARKTNLYVPFGYGTQKNYNTLKDRFKENERWSNKHHTKFYNEKVNDLTNNLKWNFRSSREINWRKTLKNQLEPSPWPSTNLRGKQIRISFLYTSHKISDTRPKEKF